MQATIGDLALLGDCATAALVGRDGSVDWWPGPRFDGPTVFARVLDPKAGHFSVRPVAGELATRAYVPGTMVLQTDYRTPSGVLRITDCLALAPGARGHDIGLRSPDALVRLVEAVGGPGAGAADAVHWGRRGRGAGRRVPAGRTSHQRRGGAS